VIFVSAKPPAAVKESARIFVMNKEFIGNEVKLLRRPALLCYVSQVRGRKSGRQSQGMTRVQANDEPSTNGDRLTIRFVSSWRRTAEIHSNVAEHP